MASKKKQTTPPPANLPKGSLNEISLAYILPDQNNPRKELSDLGELSDSLRQYGLLQPITVHANDAGGFDLICGHRRYEAARLIGWETIPAIVYPTLDPDLVFELQVTENLQRKDINPMEESDAFAEIIRRRRGTPQSIADRLGKSTQYVYDRLALQHVVDEVQSAIRAGHVGVKVAKKFARFTPADQEKLCETMGRRFDAAALDKAAEAMQASLADANFNITDAELVPEAGACTKCPKRSGCNKLLFDDVQSDDRCFDTTCYNAKVKAGIQATKAKLEAEGKTVVLIDASYSGQDGLIGRNEYDVISEEEADQPGAAIGIVARVPGWHTMNGLTLGKVVNIVVNTPDDEETDDWDEDDDTEDGQPTTGGIKKLTAKVDHDEEINKRIINALLKRFDTNTFTFDWNKRWYEQGVTALYNLSNAEQIILLEKFGIEPQASDFNHGNTESDLTREGAKRLFPILVEKAGVNEQGFLNFIGLLEAMHKLTVGYWDNDELEDEDLQNFAESCDFPISAIVQEYCAETGYSLS